VSRKRLTQGSMAQKPSWKNRADKKHSRWINRLKRVGADRTRLQQGGQNIAGRGGRFEPEVLTHNPSLKAGDASRSG